MLSQRPRNPFPPRGMYVFTPLHPCPTSGSQKYVEAISNKLNPLQASEAGAQAPHLLGVPCEERP